VPPIRFSNGPLPPAPNTILTQSIPASGGGTVTVADATYLPSAGPFLLVIDTERLLIDAISGTTLTYSAAGRGVEGTTAAAHASGAAIYQTLSVATLARHIDDRAAKGTVDFAQILSDVILSTVAGTYTDVVVGNPIAVQAGRRYRLTCSGPENILIGGSGLALTDTWIQRFQVDEGAGYIELPLGGPSYVFRMLALNATRIAPVVKVSYYVPAADTTVTFKWQMAKLTGAGTVTTTLVTAAGATPLTLAVEDIGAVP
jgi:hypothetical protein